MDKKPLFSVTKDDFRIDVFRSGGKGGQHQNKTNSGVRVTHIDSGAVGECRETRSQFQNKKQAFLRCVKSPTFQGWLRKKSAEKMLGYDSIVRKVDYSMDKKNIVIETYDGDKWVEIGEEN